MRNPRAAGGHGSDWPQTWPALLAWLLDDWRRVLRMIVLLAAVVATARVGGHACAVVIDDLARLIR